MLRFAAVALVAVTLVFGSTTVQAAPLGPTPYLSVLDSPFTGPLFFEYFHLETFEDHTLSTPGVTGTGTVTSVVPFGGTIIDSVQADGPCPSASAPTPCDSYFGGSGTLTFTFNAGILGALPTHVGLVWTDGAGDITFTAVGADGGVIGPISGIPDGDFFGGTAEDRFFGWTSDFGISSITISNSLGGIEIDHLQYGRIGDDDPTAVPEPTSLFLMGTGALGLVAKVRNRRKQIGKS
jgi:hypothetical protein